LVEWFWCILFLTLGKGGRREEGGTKEEGRKKEEGGREEKLTQS
jgi:hypothetical protein